MKNKDIEIRLLKARLNHAYEKITWYKGYITGQQNYYHKIISKLRKNKT